MYSSDEERKRATPTTSSDEEGELTGTKTASAPFDSPNCADIVLRTSDGVEFHVYKSILSIASPIFRDMFSLPLPPKEDPTLPALPIDVAEPSATWDQLLRLCYPDVDTAVSTLTAVHALLEASRKYIMSGIAERMHQTLLLPRFIETYPIQVYALGSCYGLPDVMRAAARASLRLPVFDCGACNELDLIIGNALLRLYEYHRACAAAACAAVDPEGSPWKVYRGVPRVDFLFVTCKSSAKLCPRAQGGARAFVSAKFLQINKRPTKYWEDYIARIKAVVEVRPAESPFTTRAMLAPAVMAAKDCAECRSKVYEDLAEFGEWLGKKVGEAISKIDLKVDI